MLNHVSLPISCADGVPTNFPNHTYLYTTNLADSAMHERETIVSETLDLSRKFQNFRDEVRVIVLQPHKTKNEVHNQMTRLI